MGTRVFCCHSNGNLEFHFCGIRSITVVVQHNYMLQGHGLLKRGGLQKWVHHVCTYYKLFIYRLLSNSIQKGCEMLKPMINDMINDQ